MLKAYLKAALVAAVTVAVILRVEPLRKAVFGTQQTEPLN